MILATFRTAVLPAIVAAMIGHPHLLAQTISSGASSGTGGGAVLLRLEPPVYPPIARAARVSGDVRVLVLVGANGTVTSANVESGPAMLRDAALRSASLSQFACQNCATGAEEYHLVFSFTTVDDGDCCEAFSRPFSVQQGPEDKLRHEAHVVLSVPAVCLCDPASDTVSRRTRSVKCLWLWKCGWESN